MFSALSIQTECLNFINKKITVILKMSFLSTFRLIEKLLCSRSLKNFPQLCLQPVFTFPILSNFQVPPLRHQRRPAPFHGPPTFPRRDSPPPPQHADCRNGENESRQGQGGEGRGVGVANRVSNQRSQVPGEKASPDEN